MSSFARQQASQDHVDLYFAPSVGGYGMLEWARFDRIVEAGYLHAREQLAACARATGARRRRTAFAAKAS
jgi:NTE family protein